MSNVLLSQDNHKSRNASQKQTLILKEISVVLVLFLDARFEKVVTVYQGIPKIWILKRVHVYGKSPMSHE